MAGNFSLDMSKFEGALLRAEKETKKGIKQGLVAIKNDWVADSVDAAPIDTGNLRKQISGRIDETSIVVESKATRGDFNYGYYIHEVRGDKFIDDALDEDKAAETLRLAVVKALYEAGF